jgi:hypothetical protein
MLLIYTGHIRRVIKVSITPKLISKKVKLMVDKPYFVWYTNNIIKRERKYYEED